MIADRTDPRFTPDQLATVARIEQAPDAEEAVVERVAQAIADSDRCDRACWPGMYEERAAAAIAAMRADGAS